ncbi:alpha/beta hydrolase [Pseudotenacibaculum sp. MALMAid0570]|uniref:alpha/beta hydrolase n=1 Tax=Pseudotenacibaculum sp. MALMAid0570 TaxID=3143938 RepID=UPI0032DEF2C6
MIKRIATALLIVGCVVLIALYMFQEKIIFQSEKLDKDYTYSFAQEFEEVNLKTNDGETINALHFKVKNPKGIILFFHGNKGNLSRWGNLVSYFEAYQYDVFVIDYRNYGKSTGSYNEEAMYKDGLLAYEYVKQKFQEDQIVVYGRSLGCTFATRVALHKNPKHLILEAPFYNMKKGARFYSKLTPTFILKYQFRTDLDIPKVVSPITFFHGDEDKTTSFIESKELFQLVTSQQKKFVAISKGTHHNLKEFDLYKSELAKILE